MDLNTGLTEREQTLGDMLTELRVRLGFVAQGPASKSNEAILKSFVRDAVAYVWEELGHPERKRIARIDLKDEDRLYDFHDDDLDIDIDPRSVTAMWISEGTARWSLDRGIAEPERAEEERGTPRRWDFYNGQIELYPVPDSADRQLVIEYIDREHRFDQMSDRCPVPSRLAFLYALANAKAHYHQQDAQAVASEFQQMLSRVRGSQSNGLRFNARKPESSGWYIVRTSKGDIGVMV